MSLIAARARSSTVPRMASGRGPLRRSDAVGGGERFAGDARLRHGAEEGVDHLVRDTVADLVGMAFGNRLAREEIG
jgi:hypothetical protein